MELATIIAALNRAGRLELYHKPFAETEHPRGHEGNPGQFRKKDDAPAAKSEDDGDDPLKGLPKPADVVASIKDNRFEHAGYQARIVPNRGAANSWSVLLKHPDGQETEHDLEDRRGRPTMDAARRGLHGLIKAHMLSAAKAKPKPSAVAPSPPDDRLAKLAERRDPDGISEQPVDKELRRQVKEAAPPPAKPKGGGLFGDIELPKPEAWTPPRYKPGERPHGVRTMPGGLWTGPATMHKDDLSVDPSRFQYKIAGIDSRTGVTKELKGVAKYNPLLGGQLLVWHDPEDGRTYVVNGHHRAELAKRSSDWDSDESGPGWHGEMQTFFIPAKTAQEARAWGALANIAEGRGTATDAAKFMRDTGASADALKSRGISMSGRVTQDATDLAGLSDKTFQHLANGRVTENRALSIARHVKDHTLQDKLFDLIQQREREDGEEVTDSEIAEVARALELAGTTKVKGGKAGGMLFGDDDEWDEPLLWQRAAVTSAIRRGLTTERNVFRAVSTDNRVKRISEVGENKLDVDANKTRAQSAAEALYLFDKLANSKGELSDLLHRHAERMYHEPHNRKRIIDDAKREAIDTIARHWGNVPDAAGSSGSGDAGGEPSGERYARTAAGRHSTPGGEVRLSRRGQLRLLTLANALTPHAVGAINYSREEHAMSDLTGVVELGNKTSKIDAGYGPATNAARCGRCESYRNGKCAKVAGDIDAFNSCRLFTPSDNSPKEETSQEQYARVRDGMAAALNRSMAIPAATVAASKPTYGPSPLIEAYALFNAMHGLRAKFLGSGPAGVPSATPRPPATGFTQNMPGDPVATPNLSVANKSSLPVRSAQDYAAGTPHLPGNWDEQKHPRNHGKFASKGGPHEGAGAKPAPAAAEPEAPFALARQPAHKPAAPAAAPLGANAPKLHQQALWHGLGDQPGQKKLFDGLDMGGPKPKAEATPKTPPPSGGQAPAARPAPSAPPAAPAAQPQVATAPQDAAKSPAVPQDVKDAAGVAEPHTPPPPGHTYAPDPGAAGPSGIADAARVGVPGNVVPPPPKEIPRLPNLTPEERQHENAFATMFESNPDAFADELIRKMQAGEIGDFPNSFETDAAKMLYPQWRGQAAVGADGKPTLDPQTKQFRSTMNTALHQTANAGMKRAFLRYLDSVVMRQPEGNRHVLATAGGVAAGKGWALKNIGHMNSIQQSASAVWDAAGEQNSTELPWLADECAKRGIKMTAVFVHANPQEVWATPKGGVIERAGNKGRMVDARAFADSYTHGARNFHAFAQQHAGNPMVATAVINNPRGQDPAQIAGIPAEALAMDPEQLYATCLQQLSASPQATPPIKAGGAAGLRIWGPPNSGANSPPVAVAK